MKRTFSLRSVFIVVAALGCAIVLLSHCYDWFSSNITSDDMSAARVEEDVKGGTHVYVYPGEDCYRFRWGSLLRKLAWSHSDAVELNIVDAASCDDRINDAAIRQIQRFKALKRLGISAVSVGGSAFDLLTDLTQLESVGFWCMSVTPAHVRWLRSLSAATKVSFLGCAIFPGVIDELSTMPTLTEIDCSRSEFVGDGFPALAKISSLRAITVEQVGDDDFRAIARIRSLRVLTVQAARGRGAATAKRISWETIREVRAARPDLVIEYDVGS